MPTKATRGKAERDVDSHYVEFDAVDLGHGRARALCGEIVYIASNNTAPSCQECQRVQARIDAMVFE